MIGAGWLATTLAGMAAGGLAGGLVGSLTDAGVDDSDAHVYAEGIKRGGTMVVARVDEAQAEPAEAILGQHGRVDISERRTEYEASGLECVRRRRALRSSRARRPDRHASASALTVSARVPKIANRR